MKATFEHIEPNLSHSSFTAYWRQTDYFDFHWHYHPELELTYIHQGSGTRLVGDHAERYEDGDLVLLGSNLPHTWASELKGQEQSAIVVQFRQELIGNMLNVPEFNLIKELLDRTPRGLVFGKTVSQHIEPQLSAMLNLEGIQKLTELWRILDQLATTDAYRLLASPIYRPSLVQGNEQRIDRACQHIHQHFTRRITLQEMATITHMTEPSFSRFFKKMTGKPFTAYVNELRVSRAQRLLQETNAPVSQIAYATGFESSTHFNRVFFQKNHTSPRDFRKGFLTLQKKGYPTT